VSDLARLQGHFQAYLLRGARAIEAEVQGTERVPVAVRLGIYAGAYGSRLTDALASNYPALAGLLGEEEFRALGAAYVASHDSACYSIRYYGDGLAEFLAAQPPYAEAPVLAELARFEWALSGVFDAPDAEPIGPEALAAVAPAEWAALRFAWHPSVRRLALNWNAPQLWKALTSEGAERPELAVLAEPLEWLAWRRGLETLFRSLTRSEAAVLDTARAGASFGELCELLAAGHGASRAPGEAAALLHGWLVSGLIVAALRG
jgi:hypothetical protein